MATYISETTGKIYYVTANSCTCGDYIHRQAKVGGKCKHMIELFYPILGGYFERQEEEKELNHFKDGLEFDMAYELFGDDKVNKWLRIGEICKHRGKKDKEIKFYRLI